MYLQVLFPLAKKLINGTIRNGDTVTVTVSGDGQHLDVHDNHVALNRSNESDVVPKV